MIFHSEHDFWEVLVCTGKMLEHEDIMLKQSCLVQIDLLNSVSCGWHSFGDRTGSLIECLSHCGYCSVFYLLMNMDFVFASNGKTSSVYSWLCYWLFFVFLVEKFFY